MRDRTISDTTQKPRAKEPHERIQTHDTVGKLKYLGRTRWRNTATNQLAPRMQVQCYPPLGGCGQVMEWASQEFARRRRRWAKLKLTPQCKECEHRELNPRQTRPLWERNQDAVARDRLHTLWVSMQHERVRQDRTMRGNRKMMGYLYGDRYCDALQFHIDRRWTSVFEGNPDPFETFLFDMGVPPDHKRYLLRRDPYGPMCKQNCYWGDSNERRVNRSDNPTALRALGTRIVCMPTSMLVPDAGGTGEVPEPPKATYMPYAVVEGSACDPRTPDMGRAKAWFV